MLRKILVSTCAVSALFALSPLNQSIAAELKKPNFVTIGIDDMGFSDIGAFGGEVATPNLDNLASGGTIMTNFYAAPTSTPSRAMFFTGKDNHKAGVGNMDGFVATRPQQQGQPGYEGKLSKDVKIFPAFLKAGGYRTMMTGKWDLGDAADEDPYTRGFFDDTMVLLPGGDMHYLSNAEGKLLTSQPPSYYADLKRTSPYTKNGVEVTSFPPNAFSTDYYTSSAIEMLDSWKASNSQTPFYLNIAHIAPHGPFQAPADKIEKYMSTYSVGWDKIREARFAKLKQLGYIPADLTLPPYPTDIASLKAWDKLTSQQQAVEVRRMATYAGLIEKLDDSIGVLINKLKEMGEYENTVFFIFSDNGAAAIEAGSPAKQKYVNATFTKDDFANLNNIGSATSFVPASPGWGTVSNTPFFRYKNSTYEGGMHTAAFVSYAGSKSNGKKYDCMTSVMDIAPTILEMGGVTYSDTVPMDGVSFKKLFDGDMTCNDQRVLGFEQDGIRMTRQGDWKLAQEWDYTKQRWDSNIHLFNVKTDPTEQHDMRFSNPEKYQALLALYAQYAKDNKVIDVGARIFGATAQGTLINGEPSTIGGFILGGTQVNYNGMNHPASGVKAKADNIVDIAGEINPPAEHVGKPGQVLVVAYFQPTEGAPMWLTFGGADRPDSGFSIAPWNGTLEGIPTFRDFSAGMPTRIDVPIYEGLLFAGLSGQLDFLIGYRMQDGTLVYNSKPFSLTVE